jgi:YfiH family protein
MPQVHALSTSRRGGSSAAPYDDGAGGPGLNLGAHVGDDPASVAANRARLRASLPTEPAWLAQVHGADVVDAAQLAGTPEADASFSTRPGVVCAVLTADCLPVLLADRAGRVVGASHAGWRGLAGGVLQATVERMRAAGAQDMQAWLGPAIGPRRFEVGPEVRAAFVAVNPGAEKAFRPRADNKYLADIYLLARLVLQGCGVTAVSGGERCTVSEADCFYSYRRDGVTGRMASLIWLAA